MVTDLEHEPEVDRDDNGACTLQHSQGALDGGAGVAVRMAAAIGEVVAHAHAINSMACRFAVTVGGGRDRKGIGGVIACGRVQPDPDRQRVVEGTSVSVRVYAGGAPIIQKKRTN